MTNTYETADDAISLTLIISALKNLFFLNAAFLLGMTLFRVVFFFFFSGQENFTGLHVFVARAFFLGA